MNTLGEHLIRAEQCLTVSAQTIETQTQIDAERSKALLSQCHQTAAALRELLTATWGPAGLAPRWTSGGEPSREHETLVAMVNALDQRIGLPAGWDTAITPLQPEARAVVEAREEIHQAAGILHAHVRADRTPLSPEAAQLATDGARWMLTERIASISTALADVETKLAARGTIPRQSAQRRASGRVLGAAGELLDVPHQADTRVLSIHEAGHRPLDNRALSGVAGLLERLCQRLWERAEAGTLDGVSVRAAATTGVFVTGHLEVIARSTQHRATDLWTGVLGEIREQQLRRVTAEALTARQAWQALQSEIRPLQPVGQPDTEMTGLAAQVRAGLESLTRRDEHWRPIEDLVRSRSDVEDLMRGAAQVAPDAEALASLLDRGLATARSADLCIRANLIPDPHAYVEERLRRQWVPAPPELFDSVRASARMAEAATRTMALSADETRLSITHQSPEPTIALAAKAAAQQQDTANDVRQRQTGPRQR